MIDYVSSDDIPKGGVFPKGVTIMTIGDGDDAPRFEETRNGNKLMAVIPVTVSEVISGGAREGAHWTIRIFIGTEDDPGADLLDTWKGRGGQDMDRFWHGVYGQDQEVAGNPLALLQGTAGYSVGVVSDIDGEFNRWQFFTPGEEPPPHREFKGKKQAKPSVPSRSTPAARTADERGAAAPPARPTAGGNGSAAVRPARRPSPMQPAR